MTPDKTLEKIKKMTEPCEVRKFITGVANLLTEDRFFAFVGSDYERYHGIMVAIFKKENKYAILIHNAFKPSGRKGEYFYLETVEDVLSSLEKDVDVRDIIMGISSKAYFLQTPRKEDGEIDLVEMIRCSYRTAGTKLVQLILPGEYDRALMIGFEKLLPSVEVVSVGNIACHG
jgi:hypothetical protein